MIALSPRELADKKGFRRNRKKNFWDPKSGHLFHGLFCLPGPAIRQSSSDLTCRTCWTSPVSKWGEFNHSCQTQSTCLIDFQKYSVTVLSIQICPSKGDLIIPHGIWPVTQRLWYVEKFELQPHINKSTRIRATPYCFWVSFEFFSKRKQLLWSPWVFI